MLTKPSLRRRHSNHPPSLARPAMHRGGFGDWQTTWQYWPRDAPDFERGAHHMVLAGGGEDVTVQTVIERVELVVFPDHVQALAFQPKAITRETCKGQPYAKIFLSCSQL